MKYFDAFSGYGGFSLGIQKAYANAHRGQVGGIKANSTGNEAQGEGLVAPSREGTGAEDGRTLPGASDVLDERPLCIGFSEIDKYAIQVYSKHFPTHKNYGSITEIDASNLPDFDLFVGGFPCQAFSIAGKRAGFEDTRGTLIFDVFRILKEKQPRLVLLENVKGLLSHNGGRTFKTIITALTELGYYVEWQVLNAKNFGVPQNRERVFIVGHLGGFSGRQIFPIGGTDSKIDKTTKLPEQISNCLRTNYSNGKSNETYIRQLNNPKHSNDRIYDKKGISPTLNTMQGGNRQPFIKEDNESFRIRRLTPVECERLMGLPDGWTEGVSDTQRYKLCGNGVVVNVVEEIIKRLL